MIVDKKDDKIVFAHLNNWVIHFQDGVWYLSFGQKFNDQLIDLDLRIILDTVDKVKDFGNSGFTHVSQGRWSVYFYGPGLTSFVVFERGYTYKIEFCKVRGLKIITDEAISNSLPNFEQAKDLYSLINVVFGPQ